MNAFGENVALAGSNNGASSTAYGSSVSSDGAKIADLKRTRRTRSDPSGPTDRLPPNSPESESGVLGCVLLSPNECMPECIEKIGRWGSQVFYDLRHRTIYETLLHLFDNREAIDLLTVRQRLKDTQLLEQIGGDAYLATIPDAVPSAANLSYYLEFVLEKFWLRRVIETCTQIVGKVYDAEGEIERLKEDVERSLISITESSEGSRIRTMVELVKQAIYEIEELYSKKIGITGIGTGFIDLDKMTDGMHGGELIVLAARPSIGKTSLAMNMVEFVSMEQSLPVGVFSLEMTANELTKRMISSRARVNLRNIREGFMSERDFPKLTGAAGRLIKAPIYIDDTSGISITQLRAKARRMSQRYGIKLFVVDYLQLMSSDNRTNREQQISEIANGVKGIAKELDVPFILLSQLNRDVEKEKHRKPRLSDLRESGAIEQAADGVWMLYRPTKYDDEAEENDAIAVNLLVAKQRNGPTGDVPLTFLKAYTRFESAAKVSDEDIPPEQQDL